MDPDSRLAPIPALPSLAQSAGGGGSYSVARLVEAHGDLALIRLLEAITADCPKRQAKSYTDWCEARFESPPS